MSLSSGENRGRETPSGELPRDADVVDLPDADQRSFDQVDPEDRNIFDGDSDISDPRSEQAEEVRGISPLEMVRVSRLIEPVIARRRRVHMLHTGAESNLTIVCNGYAILAHSDVLADTDSHYFKSILSKGFKEAVEGTIDLSDGFDVWIIVRVLQHIYQGYYFKYGLVYLPEVYEIDTQFEEFPDDFAAYDGDDIDPEQDLTLHLEMYRAGDYFGLDSLCAEATDRFNQDLAKHPIWEQTRGEEEWESEDCFFEHDDLFPIIRKVYNHPVLRESPLRTALVVQLKEHADTCGECGVDYKLEELSDSLRYRLHNKVVRRLMWDINKGFYYSADESDSWPWICHSCDSQGEPFIKSIWLPPCGCNEESVRKYGSELCSRAECRKFYLPHLRCKDCGGPLARGKRCYFAEGWWEEGFETGLYKQPDWIHVFNPDA